ncbi:MAG: hypothetical protein ACFCU8_06405 [Thermosynechococcaceae cyanobacterium]
MIVEVTIWVLTPPTEHVFDNLRAAAAELTNQRSSIQARWVDEGNRVALITRFSMKTAAQYKVVDQIDREFKYWTFDLEDYQDIQIVFLKPTARRGDP